MTCKYPITSKSYKFCLDCDNIDCCEDADTSILSFPEIYLSDEGYYIVYDRNKKKERTIIYCI